ncbi:MAG: glycosyltransferase family 39 protein [Bacteroidetes bacterium]|nr:glycosyltransferase family 39 protein [Bacteroidota bacterium]
MSDTTARAAQSWRWLLMLILITFVLYVWGLNIWYYGDDFQYLYRNPADRLLYFFGHRNLFHGFYRPVNSSIIALTQLFAGRETWPIHLVNILVHALLAWLVYLFMRRERFTNTQAMVASIFMAFSQENAGAILSNDTFSQISGTFFGCLTLWMLYRGFVGSIDAPRPSSAPFPLLSYLLALATFVVCLASKETSVSFLPMVGVFFLAAAPGTDAWGRRIANAILRSLPFLAITLAYMWVRLLIGLSQPSTSNDGTYGFHFGFNIVRNLGQFLFAAIIPASSSTTFVAVQQRQVVTLSIIAAASLVFLVAVVVGLMRGERNRTYLPLAAFTLLGLFPAALMNHVGELYLYNSMPFISVFVGAGLGTLLARGSGMRRYIGLALLAVLLAVHAQAINQKRTEMQRNGDRARALMPKVLAYMPQVPPNGRLLLLNPPTREPEYSIFLINGYDVFKWGEHVFPQEGGRPDVTATVIDPEELSKPEYQSNALILTLAPGDSVTVYGRR